MTFLRTTGMAAALLMMLLAASTVRAEVIARDNFNYAAGEIGGLGGATDGWTSAWENFGHTEDSQVVAPSTPLTYNAGAGASALGGGNALQITKVSGSLTPVGRGYAVTTGQTPLYMRFLVRLDSDTWDSNDFMTGWLDASIGVSSDSHGDNPNLGLRAGNAGVNDFYARVRSDMAIPNVAFAAQTTYLVVAKFEDTAGDTWYTKASIWVNPVVGDEGSPDATVETDQSLNQFIGSLGWRFGGGLDSNDIFLVDDVAMASTFDAAIGVPEPTTVSVLLAGGGLLMMRHRRQ